MTKSDLEAMGVQYIGTKVNPHRFHLPGIYEEVDLHEPYSLEEIINKAYKLGFHDGTANGEARKCVEIKRVLGIDTE